ncbi:SDR family oxidoreductase [Mesorhizobium qingshengii]|uniref:3-oxoacyl-[acyl-carrier protein] reductase n=1 Tax=Mesorhizobium qingshengii TaxID=1165689 RepID=A0A1G5ZB11_9HYPH|nr:SDR family oxidoreductase [Mesorhizobium qingshengii]SDA91630.1 3-oxoacyl-[acyl-carrier protein] reductase [Mesorhizobium qingshengii]
MSTGHLKSERKALVLGGSKGLGFGVAQALAVRGVEVGIVGRGEETLATARGGLRESGIQAHSFGCDLFDQASVRDMLGEATRQMGHADIVLLNGGGPPPFPASQFEPTVWIEQFQAMVLHQIMIATHFLPEMRKRGFGRIIVVSSTSVREPIGGLTASNSLRASLAGWAKTLASEVAADGVTVNLVLPGRFATERTTYFDRMDAVDRGVDPSVIAAESQAEIPIRRYGTPSEFGAVVSFLASEQAAYVTGVALPVDGGLTRSML